MNSQKEEKGRRNGEEKKRQLFVDFPAFSWKMGKYGWLEVPSSFLTVSEAIVGLFLSGLDNGGDAPRHFYIF